MGIRRSRSLSQAESQLHLSDSVYHILLLSLSEKFPLSSTSSASSSLSGSSSSSSSLPLPPFLPRSHSPTQALSLSVSLCQAPHRVLVAAWFDPLGEWI